MGNTQRFASMDSGRIIGDILQCCQELSLHKCLEWASLVSAGLRLTCFSWQIRPSSVHLSAK